jgi:hypothetical protein
MPTAKVGDSTAPVLAAVSVAQIQGAADDEAAHLTSSRGLKISIQADQATLNEGAVRALAYDTLENAARGIDRFTANPAARNVFGQRVTAVRIAIADRPYIRIADKVLIVTFNPRTGYFGRASSKAISFALGKMFGIPSN